MSESEEVEIAAPAPETLDQESLFEGTLRSLRDVWLAIAIWNSLTLAFVFLLTGVAAAAVLRWKFRTALVVPVLAATYGLISGFVQGTLFAVAVALIYSTGEFTMEWHMAAVWGAGFSGFYVLTALLQNWLQW